MPQLHPARRAILGAAIAVAVGLIVVAIVTSGPEAPWPTAQPGSTGAATPTGQAGASIEGNGSRDRAPARAEGGEPVQVERGESARVEDDEPAQAHGEAAPASSRAAVGRGPGLAAPAPSPLHAAAAAAKARRPSGQDIRVGIQVGHWRNSELPDELSMLRGSTGAMGADWREVDVNLEVSRRIAEILASFGIQVDMLPATVPAGYRADAFVAIHADANRDANLSGFKLARSKWSTLRQEDDALVADITAAYRAATGLEWHARTITDRMTQYYAFNPKIEHSVGAATPAVIVELGFLTNARDQELMRNQPETLAEAIALGILDFLAR